MVTEGALVGQGEATQLTTIEQIDPLYVNFSLTVSELERLRTNPSARDNTPVEVLLADGKSSPKPGSLDFSDLAVDPATGSVSLRAVLDNPDRMLLPGMFVNLRLNLGTLEDAFVLPQSALARDSEGAYVLALSADGKVEQHRVQIASMTQSDWIVRGGLKDGDRVIVEGLQKVKPGASATAVAPDPQMTDSASH